MATAAQSIPQRRTWSEWFPAFLRNELDFYPGRAGKIARITIATVLTFIVMETFRIPSEVYAVISVFLVSRDTPADTIRTTLAAIIAAVIGVATVLIGALTFADSQFLHFFFLALGYLGLFFLIRILVNPVVAPNLIVGFYAASNVWDGRSSPKTQLEGCLWILLGISTGLMVACCVELVFVRGGPVEQLLRDLDRRIRAVEGVFLSLSEDRDATAKRRASEELALLAVVGTGRLRREMQVITRNHSHSLTYYTELSTAIALTGRLVDITATLGAVTAAPSEKDRQRLRALAVELGRIRLRLTTRQRIEPLPLPSAREASAGIPVLPVLEQMLQLFCLAFQPAAAPLMAGSTIPDQPKANRIWVNDALANPDHLRFAIKGALAATICYMVYSAVDWPGISTAVLTCFLTALSTIGAARQKQLNRIAGAFFGGALGIASLVFILPNIDSIAWISLVIAAGTIFSAWFATSSPRISYFGLQTALAFFLTVLQDFAEPTSLEPPRDRFVGVLLSIVVMGLVFDRLWPVTAAGEMRREFAATLRNMGRFVRVVGEDHPDGPQIAMLRETINSGFSSTHTNADSVKFEFGAERQADLAERDSILRWATEARTAYLLELSLGRGLEYQTMTHPLTLSLVEARRTFCRSAGQTLENLAAGVESGTVTETPDLRGPLGGLETEFANWFAANPEQHRNPATSGILATARQLVTVVEGIAVDIEEHASARSNALRRAIGRKGQEGTSGGTSGEC